MRGGLLNVTGGRDVSITAREAVPGDDLLKLHDVVLAQFHDELETERTERVGGTQLQLTAIRKIMQRLRPDRQDGML